MMSSPDVSVLPDGRMDRRNAAAYLGCAPKTLAQYASRGAGPKFLKRGRVWYFKEDLDAWLREGTGSGAAAAGQMELL